MITLYSFAPQDRSGRIRWLMEELELPYTVQLLNGEANEHKEASFFSLSPRGLVPVIKHEDVIMFESGAIALYLAEKFKDAKSLAPMPDSPFRGEFLKWLFFSTATLDPLLVKVFRIKGMSDSEKDSHLKEVYSDFMQTAVALENILAKSNYVIAGEFSIVDIMLSQPLDWANKHKLLDKNPILQRYLNELKNRPACIKAKTFS